MKTAGLSGLCLLLAAVFLSCEGKKSDDASALSSPAEFQQYIASSSKGLVSRHDAICVQFNQAMAGSDELGQEVGGLLAFSPSISGVCRWESPYLLVFQSDEPLAWDTRYTARLKLSKLAKVPKEKSEFSFSFYTQAPDMQISCEGLKAEENGSSYFIRGVVTTSDVFEDALVEKALSASLEGKKLDIVWEHAGETFTHTFTLSGIRRQQQNTEVKLSFQPKKASVNASAQTLTIEVPGLESFEVSRVETLIDPTPCVTLYFSDPLDERQTLKGLARIDNVDCRLSLDGNLLKLYPESTLDGEYQLIVDAAIRNRDGRALGREYRQTVTVGLPKPEIRLPKEGSIVPPGEGRYFVIQAVGLKAVDVRITKLFRNNIPYFLLNNDISDRYGYQSYGRLVAAKKVDLKAQDENEYRRWTYFKIDLSKLTDMEPGAVYHVEIGSRLSYNAYGYPDDEGARQLLPVEDELQYENFSFSNSFYDCCYDWQKSGDPSSSAYYIPWNFASRNILCTDLALMAKTDAQDNLYVFASQLSTAAPAVGASLKVYDAQMQELGSGRTDGEGCLLLSCERRPFLIVGERDGQVSYLKTDASNQIPTANFDVSGKNIQKGLKGFLFTERGVWRPGDSIHIHFMLEDRESVLPESYPLSLEIYNPEGQLVEKLVRQKGRQAIVPFVFQTSENDPTGHWRAVLKAGNIQWTKALQVESVKPNRLKIELDFGQEQVLSCQKAHPVHLQARWLTGPAAGGSKARVEASLQSLTPRFESFPDYSFASPASPYSESYVSVYEGNLDADGQADFNFRYKPGGAVPGWLDATFTTQVSEGGSGMSIHYDRCRLSPYPHYAGIHIDYDYADWNKLDNDREHKVKIVTVDENGRAVGLKNVEIKLFDTEYSWWYQSDRSHLASYVGKTWHKPVWQQTLQTSSEGLAEFLLDKDSERYGSYLLTVSLPDGHTAGQLVWFSGSWGSQTRGDAQVLALMSEKSTYQIGEEIDIEYPSSPTGRALVTVESSRGLLKKEWVQSASPLGHYRFKATAEMAPNVYVSVHFIQPHGQTANDLPIRLYGVLPICVEDPSTRLEPQLSLPEEVGSETAFTVKVREKRSLPMDYTLAIVDEGLLDLTDFKTPDPWNSFYAREALNIKTYDFYKQVLGAYGSRLESMYAVGGSDESYDASKMSDERFKPVVQVLGPFHLNAGKENRHEIVLPPYQGSVRVMLVAASDKGRYGNAQQQLSVRDPLMVQATLPRQLSPDEEISLPVNLFVNQDNIRKVKISVHTDGPISVDGDSERSVEISDLGESDHVFRLKVGSVEGLEAKASVKVTASSGMRSASQTTYLTVRQPQSAVRKTQFVHLEAGENARFELNPIGQKGSNLASVEISSMPSLNLSERLDYLTEYPHGCAEQSVSAVFPQLYLPQFMDFSKEELEEMRTRVNACIAKLPRYLTASQGISLWPGGKNADEWTTAYVALFLLEAEKAGYAVPSHLKESCLNCLQQQARNFSTTADGERHFLQAYLLYVLAAASQAQTAAMNRLMASDKLNRQGRFLLASAYRLVGQQSAADKLADLRDLSTDETYESCMGSALRDQSLILDYLTLSDPGSQSAHELAQELSSQLSSSEWFSTQATASALSALSRYAIRTGAGKEMRFQLQEKGQGAKKYQVRQAVFSRDFTNDSPLELEIGNQGEGGLFVSVCQEGIPEKVSKQWVARGIALEWKFTDLDGNPLDVSSLPQGSSFLAAVTVYDNSLRPARQLALTTIFPDGWEIVNERLANGMESAEADYQDIRDDRVLTYFDLASHESKTFVFHLTAAYRGRFQMVPATCEAMYDRNAFYAREGGMEVEVR